MPEADPPPAENCQRCGSAAPCIFYGGFSPPQAVKAVRTNPKIEQMKHMEWLNVIFLIGSTDIYGSNPRYLEARH
ncbi:MAG: hypothetical protein WC659_02385 [Patescibacteria group bacterium]